MLFLRALEIPRRAALPAGNTKGMKKKSVKNKSPAAAYSGTNQVPKPAQ
jgi:hypothetical protein